MKLNPLNAELCKKGAYNKAYEQTIVGWAKIRNDAAHGQANAFDDMQIKLMIEGVRMFIATHPA